MLPVCSNVDYAQLVIVYRIFQLTTSGAVETLLLLPLNIFVTLLVIESNWRREIGEGFFCVDDVIFSE